MKTPFLVLAVLSLGLAGCGQSKLNPLNWFGHSRKVAVATVDPKTGVPLNYGATAADGRPLVAEVETLAVEKSGDGALIRATGLMPTQGWWNAELVPDTAEAKKGVLSYRFVIAAPLTSTPVSTPQSREVTVALRVSDYQLAGVHEILVTGAQNARSTRR